MSQVAQIICTSAICEIQVKGCQLAAGIAVKDQAMFCQDKPYKM
jgi:hypothetical protein